MGTRQILFGVLIVVLTAALGGYYAWAPAAYNSPVKLYVCPSDFTNINGGLGGAGGWATTSYAYNYQVFGTLL